MHKDRQSDNERQSRDGKTSSQDYDMKKRGIKTGSQDNERQSRMERQAVRITTGRRGV